MASRNCGRVRFDGGRPMERGLLAPLSPNEEMALRRISYGSTQIPDVYVQRLMRLALIQGGPVGLQLTELGKQRLSGIGHGPPLMHVAMYEAVNAIERTHEPYLVELDPPVPAECSLGPQLGVGV